MPINVKYLSHSSVNVAHSFNSVNVSIKQTSNLTLNLEKVIQGATA